MQQVIKKEPMGWPEYLGYATTGILALPWFLADKNHLADAFAIDVALVLIPLGTLFALWLLFFGWQLVVRVTSYAWAQGQKPQGYQNAFGGTERFYFSENPNPNYTIEAQKEQVWRNACLQQGRWDEEKERVYRAKFGPVPLE